MPGINEGSVSALLVAESQTDRRLVEEIFRTRGWRLFQALDRARGMRCLEKNPVHVVIAESETPKWSWKRVLNDLRRLSPVPQLVVASRTADDYLWAEVLNIGGYDVLAQPFNREEVERVVASARRHFGVQPNRVRYGFTAAVSRAAS